MEMLLESCWADVVKKKRVVGSGSGGGKSAVVASTWATTAAPGLPGSSRAGSSTS